MRTIEIQGITRSKNSKQANKTHRREDRIPAVIYGGEVAPQSVAVDYLEIDKMLASPETYIINLNIEGETIPSVMRDVQFHPVTDKILHVDFLRLGEGVEVELELPIKLTGTSKGVLAGGKRVPLMRKIKVKGVPSELPEFVEVDISNLNLGETITVREVKTDAVNITSPESAGIAAIEIPRSLRAATKAEA